MLASSLLMPLISYSLYDKYHYGNKAETGSPGTLLIHEQRCNMGNRLYQLKEIVSLMGVSDEAKIASRSTSREVGRS